MAPTIDKSDIKKGRMKQDIKEKVVILGSKHDKKDISKEPEMKELKRMIQTGELDQERTVDHLKGEQTNEPVEGQEG